MRIIKITSNGAMHGARIELDGVDISSFVTGIDLTMEPDSPCIVRLDLVGKLNIELPAEIEMSTERV